MNVISKFTLPAKIPALTALRSALLWSARSNAMVRAANVFLNTKRLSQMVGRTKLRCTCRCLVFAASLAAASSVFAADPDNGRRLAQRWCEACHVVTPTQSRPATDQAPPFATIAKMPDVDAAKIALFLLDPHPKMPAMALSRSEAADLAAYIVSLK
jgi:mono/diheme cytochrome c family protein